MAQAAYEEARSMPQEKNSLEDKCQFPAFLDATLRKVRLEAMRSLLYETARFVEIYKAWSIIVAERS
jgi:hypothetical protein